MSAKHTNWRVAEHDHALVICADSANKTKHGASRYAAIGGFDRSDPEQYAEALDMARLIAAAPNLLAALKNLVDRVEQIVLDDQSTPDTSHARAAIAKAEGKL